MAGHIRIHHQDGTVEYNVTSAKYGFLGDKLFLEIEGEPAREHRFAKHFPLCGVELNQLPVGGSEISACFDREFVIPMSQVEEEPFRYTNFYLGTHYDLDENHIRFLKEKKTVVLEWQGVAPDVNYYDQRAKPNAVEIRCPIKPGLFDE